MTPTEPTLSPLNIPTGTEPFKFTAPVNYPDCQDLAAQVLPDGRVITAWLPDQEELELLMQGRPIYVMMWCGRRFPMTALSVDEPCLIEVDPDEKKM